MTELPRSRFLAVGALLVLGGLFPLRAGAATYVFTPLDVPGGHWTQAYGINDAGQIVGEFRDRFERTRSFLYDGSTYTTLQLPGVPRDINNAGLMVGFFDDAAGCHGYVSDGTTSTSFELPLPGPFVVIMHVHGINDLNQIVGSFEQGPTTTSHGFLKDGPSYTTFDVPGASANGTAASGINDAGQIVGTFSTLGPCPLPPFCSQRVHGFLKDGATYETLDFPAPDTRTIPIGINGAGQIVGYYHFGSVPYHGFVKNGASYTTLDVPGALQTAAFDVNNSGQIVGWFTDASSPFRGFLATPVPPEAQIEAILAILESGDVVGAGPGRSAPGRLGALTDMVESAGDLIGMDEIEGACGQLEQVRLRTDGDLPPPDFAAPGAATDEVNGLVSQLEADLACEMATSLAE